VCLQGARDREEVARGGLAGRDRPLALVGRQPLLVARAWSLVPVRPCLRRDRVADVDESMRWSTRRIVSVSTPSSRSADVTTSDSDAVLDFSGERFRVQFRQIALMASAGP
jgi:hypothetical protein